MKRILFIISASLLMCALQVSAAEYGGVEFPGGEASFADSVYSYEQGSNVDQGTLYTDPSNSLGAPDYSGGDDQYVSLGNGGTLVLRFSDNSLTTSSNSDHDLWIFEIGPAVEATEVYISRDAINWIYVGEVSGSTSGVDIDAYVGNGVVSGEKYSYVKLIDNYDDDFSSSGTSGADIDAVGAISSSQPVPIDDPPVNGTCNEVALSSFSQLDNRAAAVDTTSEGLVLYGAPWTNGREDGNGNIDGNGVSTSSTYNHMGGSGYVKFRIDAGGMYLAVYIGPLGLPFQYWSTHHSWQGSYVIPEDEWLYARSAVNESGNWTLALSLNNYDDAGGSLLNQQTGVLTQAQMDALEDAPYVVQYVDNYAGTSTDLTLAELCVTGPGSSGECTQAELDAGFEAGKQYCIDNPELCGIAAGGDFQEGYDAGYRAGLETCETNGECPRATISEVLNMHIPNLFYEGLFETRELSADFEYMGEVNGDQMWRLSYYEFQ